MINAAPPLRIDEVSGVWQRRLLITEDGRKDVTSLVWWLQLGTVCGDIRALADAQAADTAFAGTLLQSGDIFTWRPDIAQGFDTDGIPDEGRLAFHDADMLHEEGVHSPYIEHWQRIAMAGPGDRAIGFQVDGAAQPGFLMTIGPFVFIARPRPGGAPVFVLAQGADNAAAVVMALGCPAMPGDSIIMPSCHDDVLAFPAGPTGSAARYAAQALYNIR